MAVLLLGSLATSIIATLISSVRAASLEELEAQQAENQREREALSAQQKELKNAKAEIMGEISALSRTMDSIQAEKDHYDELIRLTMAEYDNLTEQIALLAEQIGFRQREYEEAEAKKAVQWEIFKEKFRIMEERGDISYLEILFEDVTSFRDLLSRMDMIDEIVRRDEGVIAEMEAAKQEVILAQQALYDAKADCELKQQEQLDAQAEMELLAEEATRRIHDLEDEMAAQQASADELQERIRALEQAIALEESEAAGIAKRIEELERLELLKNAGVSATGTYLWPSGASYYVTSRFGNRLHPILGYWRMHNGIDIGAAHGTDIYASDGGLVVTSTTSSSYGEYVMIAHGEGRYTLYAHMSKRIVKEGDTVSQGDVIGYVGSTGYATGPHIHFEIYEDDVRVDPLQFFSNYVLLD